MDVATLLGLLSSFGLIIGAILSGGPLTPFIDVASALIVIGGTMGVGFICFPMAEMLSSAKVAANAFRVKQLPPSEVLAKLVDFATKARKDGVLALESAADQESDPFLARCLKMVVDGNDRDTLEALVNVEITSLKERHKKGSEIFQALGTFAPAMGLIGTLVGLVQMLGNLDDPSSIGPAMAVALLTTFYGAILANIIFMPIAYKLKRRSGEETQVKEMVLAGILALAAGENPRVLEQKLGAFLDPASRESAGSKEAA